MAFSYINHLMDCDFNTSELEKTKVCMAKKFKNLKNVASNIFCDQRNFINM